MRVATAGDLRQLGHPILLCWFCSGHPISYARISVHVLELAQRVKLLVKKKGWSQEKAGLYFQKDRSWISHHLSIADKLNTSLVTRVTTLDYRSARKLAKLPQNKQGEAYRMAQKMAVHDRKPNDLTVLVHLEPPIRHW